MVMAIATEGTVRSLLTPFHSQMRTLFEDARAEVAAVEDFRYNQGFDDFRYPRVLADLIYDAMSNRVSKIFADDKQVRVIFESQSFKVLFFPFGEKPILARFKKGDNSGRGQNQETQSVLAFNDPNAVFPGFPEDAICLDITYSHDLLGLSIGYVMVMLRDGDRIVWSYAIHGHESGQLGLDNVTPIPTIGHDRADGNQADQLVTPKPRGNDDAKEL